MKPGKAPTPLLEYQHVTICKGDTLTKVLDDVSITIHQGENVAILGPNGAGKSSFIRSITREYYPLMGDPRTVFRIWGKDEWNVFDLRNLLGIVSGDLQHEYAHDVAGLDIVLSGFFSSVGLYRHRVTPAMKRKAHEVLAFLEIEHLAARTIAEMSTGEARRFLIGRALVHEPQALVLDEPMNSLDLHAVSTFRSCMSKIARAGISIILVTHNLQDIVPEVTRVVLMNHGRFCLDGPKQTVLNARTISRLFSTRVTLVKRNGLYYAF